VYVSESGVPSALCGVSTLFPCAGVEMAWSQRLDTNGTIYILSGVHPVNCRGPSAWVITLEGINIPSDAEEEDYPGVYPGNNAGCWLNISYGNQKLTLTNLRLIYSSGFTGHLFRTYANTTLINITNCFLTVQNGVNIPNSVYVGDYGVISAVNSIYHNLYFSGSYGLVRFEYYSSTNYIFFNCTFHSILITSKSYAAIIHATSSLTLNFTNNFLFNITANYVSASLGSLLHTTADGSMKFTDLYFENITSNSSALRFISAYSDSLSNLQFYNVTTNSNGAAIYISSDSTSYQYTISNSIFSKCVTTNSYGGMCFFIV
jgi:hypothetical protein